MNGSKKGVPTADTPIKGRRYRQMRKKDIDSDHSDTGAKQKSQKKSKRVTVLEPIESSAICKSLREVVLEDSVNGEREFLNSEEHREAFVTAKVANPKIGKRRGGKGNIFHHLVQGTGGWTYDELIGVLQWLFNSNDQVPGDRQDSAFTCRPFDSLLLDELGNQTAMHMALDAANNAPQFVEAILDLEPEPESLAAALCMPLRSRAEGDKEPSTGNTCLHYAISQGSADRIEIFHRMENYFKVLCEDHWHPLRIQEPNGGNTPLHLGIIMGRVGSVPRLLKRLADLPEGEYLGESIQLIALMVNNYCGALEIGNHADRTPYQERIHCIEESEEVSMAIMIYREIAIKAKYPPPQSVADVDGVALSGDFEALVTVTRDIIESLRRRDSEKKPKKSGQSRLRTGPFGRIGKDSDSKQLSEQKKREADGENERLEREARAVLRDVEVTLADESVGANDLIASNEYRKIVIGDPIVEYLRNYCIRNMEREKVMDCLYPPGEELAIEFNLAGTSRKYISDEYLRSFQTHLRLEATLNHVVLPKLTFSSKNAKAANSNSRDSKLPANRKGVTDLTNIFDWLRKQNVKKILKVTVFDDDFPCHTDAAIIECLKGFSVETWNWRRVDLSSEVIRQASSEVRNISLYCSGNQAVLKGWSAKGGFEDRKAFPKLETVTVYLREGQEDSSTLESYGLVFQEDIENTMHQSREERERAQGATTSDDAEFEMVDNERERIATTPGVEPDLENIAYRGKTQLAIPIPKFDYKIDRYPYGMLLTGDTGSSDASGHPRITYLRNLATFFRNNRDTLNSPTIKIAILDDGLDSSLDMLKTGYTRLEAGLAFQASEKSNMSDYYVPAGHHGSRVASLICSICPVTSLYVAKLEHEAVRWATRRGVDIINMSWTIETSSEEQEPGDLKDAITDAKNQGIIMFCSASDQGGDSKKYCYPRNWPGTCVGIGSLSATDTPSLWLQPDQIDFMFPGENLAVQNNDGTMVEDSGSSFATAVATGLGGLLIYCTLVLRIGSTSSMRKASVGAGNAAQDSKEKGHFAWDYELMRRIFGKLSGEFRGVTGRKLARPEQIVLQFVEQLRSKRPLRELELDGAAENVLRHVFGTLRADGPNASWDFK